jgi:hypothetical protein
MQFRPTTEQQQALDLFATGQSLVIEAGAGTGKTSTLTLLANSTTRRGQYIAFNKAIVTESKSKFPATVNCSTAHGLAMREVGRPYQPRLGASGRVRPDVLAKMLGVKAQTVKTYTGDDKYLGAGFLAGLVMRSIVRFCQSADMEPMAKHVERVETLDTPLAEQHGLASCPVNDALAKSLVPVMRKAWDTDLCRYDGSLPFRHDHYLKLWHLSGPKIEADYIMFDEAQDANPVLQAIIAAQTHAQIVYVGDSQQSIYGFTGAVNALKMVKTDARTFLTQSFRFGPAVAEVANEVLDMLNADLRLKGFDKLLSVVTEVEHPDAILTRTNAGALREMLEAQQAGKKVALVGGSKEIVAFALAARRLMNGERVEHPELACFENWDEVVNYVEMEEDGNDLRLLVTIIQDFGVEEILTALGATANERDADVVISTAHKSKGREWDRVRLGNDFPTGAKAKDEELRLLYVAVTRAKLELDVTLVATLDDAVASAMDKQPVRPAVRPAAPAAKSAHVGRVGGSIEATLTVTSARTIKTKYGTPMLYKLTDDEGNVLTWITKDDSYGEGDVLEATWDVKKHDEFRGVKETMVGAPTGLVKLEKATA